jgi:hypothetical protein
MALLSVPTFDTSLHKGGKTSSVWYRYFQGIAQGIPPSNEATVSVGGSPFYYTAPSKGFLVINGGTVTAVQFTRSVTTLTGQTSGIFPVSQGDVLTITYTVLPTLVFVPQ